MIYVITCSTNRPKSFALVQRCMARQTVKPDSWIICGENHANYKFDKCVNQMVIERTPALPPSGRHSYCDNLLLALLKVDQREDTKVLIWEDEEYYGDTYIEDACNALDSAPLVGIRLECYYYLKDRILEYMPNFEMATMATTSFQMKTLYPLVELIAARGQGTMDTPLYNKSRHKRILLNNNCVNGIRHISFKQIYTDTITIQRPTYSEPDKRYAWLRKNCPDALEWIGLVTDNTVYRDWALRSDDGPSNGIRDEQPIGSLVVCS